VRLMVRKMR